MMKVLHLASLMFCLCVLFVGELDAKQVPDGIWNGKPWDAKVLEAGVKKGDKDALAEWAYCSFDVLEGVHFDEALIAERARKAADKGSLLGAFVLGYCYYEGFGLEKDYDKGLKWIRKSAAGGHPKGQFGLIAKTLYGAKNAKFNGDVIKSLEKLRAQGVWAATRVLGFIYKDGDLGVVDTEKAAMYFREVLESYDCARTSYLMFRIYKYDRPEPVRAHLPEKLLRRGEAILRKAASMEHIDSMFLLSLYNVERGNPHLGVPVTIALARRSTENHPRGGSNLVWRNHIAFMFGKYSRHENATIVSGDIISQWEAAEICYKEGNRDDLVLELYCDGKLRRKREGVNKAEEDEGVRVCREIIRENPGMMEPHNTMGHYFALKYTRRNGNKQDHERGMAHLIWSLHYDVPGHWVTAFYLTDGKGYNRVKGLAAAEWSMKKSSGHYLKAQKNWVKHARKNLTPQEEKEVKRLVDEGFPHSEKFQKQAFDYLQKIGDVPAERKFKEDEKDENEGLEDAFFREGGHQLLAALLISLPEVVDSNALYKLEELKLIESCLENDKLKKEDLAKLVTLVMGDEKKLKAILQSLGKGEHADKVKRLIKIVGNEHTHDMNTIPIQATVAWYLICRDGELTSIPHITKMKEGSPVEKAGVEIGDVFEECYGQSLRSDQSRNKFVRLLFFWPKANPMELSIRRNVERRWARCRGTKTVHKTLQVTFE